MTLRLATCLALLATAACAQQQPALYASPADQPAYAERYPAALSSGRTTYAADEQQAHAQAVEFQKFPDALDKPSWPVVEDVVKAADEAGKSGDLANGMAQAEAVRTFYAGAKAPIHQKVAGSVDYAAKQKECKDAAELPGTAVSAMDRAIDQELEQSIRDHNPASRLIEDNQDAIGKQNVDKLTKQADQIALASYLVHVRMPQTKRNLDAALTDASEVKKTLEAEQKRAEAVLADKNASRPAKTTAEKRQKATFSALAAIDSEVNAAKALSAEMDKRAQAAQKDYQQAFDALVNAIEEKAKAEAATAKK
jgi:hypothetical protein